MCQSDLSITKEISENPNQRPGPMAKVTIFSIFKFYIFHNPLIIQNDSEQL